MTIEERYNTIQKRYEEKEKQKAIAEAIAKKEAEKREKKERQMLKKAILAIVKASQNAVNQVSEDDLYKAYVKAKEKSKRSEVTSEYLGDAYIKCDVRTSKINMYLHINDFCSGQIDTGFCLKNDIEEELRKIMRTRYKGIVFNNSVIIHLSLNIAEVGFYVIGKDSCIQRIKNIEMEMIQDFISDIKKIFPTGNVRVIQTRVIDHLALIINLA